MSAAADLAIVGARIRTLDPRRPHATAVAIRRGTIVAVGSDAEVRDHCDAATDVVDAGGRALVPGLVDGHLHPFWGAELARGIDLSDASSLDDVGAVLREARAATGRGEWIFAHGLDYDVFPGGALDPEPVVAALDGAPAFVRSADGHAAVASPRALELAGVTAPVAFDDGSEVVVRDGRPTGELRELSAQALVLAAAPERNAAELRADQAATLRRMNAVGLTGAHVMDGSPETFSLLRELEASGELTMRVVVPFWLRPDMDDEEIDALLPLRDERGELWRGGVGKLFVDGVIDAGTAWLEAPDSFGAGTEPYWPQPARFSAVVDRFARAGFQVATHAIGDRGVRHTLEAYVAAGSAPGVRHRIEHLETLPDALVEAIARAGVVASMQPIHLRYVRGDGSGSWAGRLGDERAQRAFRTADLLRAGATVALGSDWPVAPYDPRLGLAAAQLRRDPLRPDAPPACPEQALTGLQALAGYTTGCAAAVGEEALGGRIAPGMRADLTGLDADPVEVAAADLPELPVWLTAVGGRVVHGAS
jgi:predicted amidohydrolase YtcJ